MFDDFDEGDFADLGLMVGRKHADLVMSCISVGRHSARRVSFNFAPSVLAEIGGPRYAIGYARSRRTGQYAFRIQAQPMGAFESFRPGRGDRLLLRCPLPAVGFADASGFAEPEFYVDQIGKAILIELPDLYIPPKPKALPPPTPRSADLDDETQKAIDHRLREMLGGGIVLPRVIGGEEYTSTERGILAALLKHTAVRREGLQAACHDPEKGEDDRDPKIVDVTFSKMWWRLEAIGVEIVRVDTGTYGLSPASKAALRSAAGLEEPRP